MTSGTAELQMIELQEDEKSRTRALEFTSFIVEAPAGAGKTELLTQRFLKLLQVVDEPEEIIAITFTNKAAAEMRLRVLDSLLKAAAGEKPTLVHKQITYELSCLALQRSTLLDWRLLENPARLRIFTIDGLCAYLTRQMPLMSRFGSQPNIADDASVHYAEAAERTLDLIDDENGEVVKEALRYLDNDANQLKKLLVRMLGLRDQWLHQSQQTITPVQLQNTLSRMVSEELAAIAKSINAPIQHTLMPLARYAASNLPCEHSVALLRDWDTYLPVHAESLVMWQSVADLLLTGTDSLRKTITVKEGFPVEGKSQKQDFIALLLSLSNLSGVQEALARIRVLPALINHHASWEMIATLSKLLNLAAAQLWLVFSQAREVDFVEVSKRAIGALAGEFGEPTELALRLDYQIKHLLVDEFQDTSPSQIELLEKLTQGWQQDDGRTLFAVGDPMQSIYRFRKANVGLFLGAALHGIGDIHLQKLSLYRNNRSCPPVVDWINRTFQMVFPRDDDTAKGAIAYRQFIATRQDDDDTGIEIHPIIKLADESAELAKKREAQAVIDVIVREQAAHPMRKIAILVRAKSHLQTIVSELRRNYKQIRFQAVEIEPLSNRQIVQDLLALTRALHHRADRVHWLAMLRAPWCGLTLHDLHALAGHDHYSTVWSLMQQTDIQQRLSGDGQARLAHVNAIFYEAFAAQGRVNVSRWVRSVWLMLGGATCLWEANDVIDVQAFFDCIDKLDRNNQFSLERMATEIDKLFAAPDVEGENLQMMSIHKSKGLEFDTVILPGLGNVIGGNDDKPIVLWEEVMTLSEPYLESAQSVTLLAAPLVPKGLADKGIVTPYDYLNALEKERANNEDARILYVAATRAERKLHWVGIANQNKKGEINPVKNTYLDMLWPVAAEEYLSASLSQTSAPQMTEEVATNGINNFVPKLVRLEKLQLPKDLHLLEDLQWPKYPQAEINLPPGQRKSSNKVTVASANTSSNEPNALEADIGILTHRYLEIITNQGLEKWDAARVSSLSKPMHVWFFQQGYADKEAIAAAKQVQQGLIATLNSGQGQWVLQNHAQASAELTMIQMRQSEAQMYVVDRTFVVQQESKAVRWIIDYKSVALASNASDNTLKAIAEQYRDQLESYVLLFINEGLPVHKAIFFVSLGRLFEIK